MLEELELYMKMMIELKYYYIFLWAIYFIPYIGCLVYNVIYEELLPTSFCLAAIILGIVLIYLEYCLFHGSTVNLQYLQVFYIISAPFQLLAFMLFLFGPSIMYNKIRGKSMF